MLITANSNINHNGKEFKKGDRFDCDKKAADQLVETGVATMVETVQSETMIEKKEEPKETTTTTSTDVEVTTSEPTDVEVAVPKPTESAESFTDVNKSSGAAGSGIEEEPKAPTKKGGKKAK